MIASDDLQTPAASLAAVARREYRLFKWGIVLALALGCASPLALNLVDPDLWGHVRYAEDWLADESDKVIPAQKCPYCGL